MRKAEWIKIVKENPEMPDKDTNCRVAFRATFKSFDYHTMGQIFPTDSGIGEVTAYFDDTGKWVLTIDQYDAIYESYDGCDIVHYFTSMFGDIKFEKFENIAIKQVVNEVTKKKKYIEQLEIEILAWWPMPDDYEETDI